MIETGARLLDRRLQSRLVVMLALEGAAVSTNVAFPLMIASLVGATNRNAAIATYVIIAAIAAAEIALLLWRRNVEFEFVRQMEMRTRARVHETLFSRPHEVNAMALMTSDTTEYRRYLTLGLIYAVVNSVLAVVLVVVLISVTGILGIICALILVVLTFIAILLQRPESRFARAKLSARADLAAWLTVGVGRKDATKEAGAEEFVMTEVAGRADRLRQLLRRQINSRVRYLVLLDGSVSMAVIGALLVGWLVGQELKYSAPVLSAFTLLAAQLVWPLQSLGAALPLVRSGAAAGRRLNMEDQADASDGSGLDADVRLSPDRGELDQLSGDRPLVVGVAGKDATARRRLLAPTVHRLQPPEARGQAVGWARDRPALFHAPLSENLYLGRSGDRDEALWALRTANAEFALTADGMIREEVTYEGRHRISTGQAARLGVARAFYVAHELVVLEESLQSLDTASAAEIVSRFRRQPRGRAALIITTDNPELLEFCDIVIDARSRP